MKIIRKSHKNIIKTGGDSEIIFRFPHAKDT